MKDELTQKLKRFFNLAEKASLSELQQPKYASIPGLHKLVDSLLSPKGTHKEIDMGLEHVIVSIKVKDKANDQELNLRKMLVLFQTDSMGVDEEQENNSPRP